MRRFFCLAVLLIVVPASRAGIARRPLGRGRRHQRGEDPVPHRLLGRGLELHRHALRRRPEGHFDRRQDRQGDLLRQLRPLPDPPHRDGEGRRARRQGRGPLRARQVHQLLSVPRPPAQAFGRRGRGRAEDRRPLGDPLQERQGGEVLAVHRPPAGPRGLGLDPPRGRRHRHAERDVSPTASGCSATSPARARWRSRSSRMPTGRSSSSPRGPTPPR